MAVPTDSRGTTRTLAVASRSVAVPPVTAAAAAVASNAGSGAAYTGTQWQHIDAAVQSSFSSIQAGGSVASFGEKFAASLAGSGLSPQQIASLTAAFDNVDAHGSAFREQGNSAAPFVSAWDARLHQLFGTLPNYVAPVAPVAPPVKVAPSTPTPPPALAPAAAAPIPANAAPDAQAAAASAAIAATQTQLAAVVAALAKIASPPAAVTASAVTTDTTAGNASTGSGTDDASNAYAAGLLAAAKNATVPGSGSIAGGIGYADTSNSGDTTANGLVQSKTSNTGPSVSALLILGLVLGAGGYLWWRSHHGAAT